MPFAWSAVREGLLDYGNKPRTLGPIPKMDYLMSTAPGRQLSPFFGLKNRAENPNPVLRAVSVAFVAARLRRGIIGTAFALS
ncbi:MAG: hypothetical protein LBM64_07165, partial [Deltaproteobacteria bacterium]|nr:hypothetical protein [Deltaproteobacteria bacterium]